MRAFEGRLFHFIEKNGSAVDFTHMYHLFFHVNGVIVFRNVMLFELEMKELMIMIDFLFLHVLEKRSLREVSLRRQELYLPLVASCACGVRSFLHFVLPGGEWWLIYI